MGALLNHSGIHPFRNRFGTKPVYIVSSSNVKLEGTKSCVIPAPSPPYPTSHPLSRPVRPRSIHSIGLSLGTNLGPPSFASAPSGQGTPASLPTSHCWNPLDYENSLLGKPSSSTAHPSIAGHQTSGPSRAPSDQHHIDALDGMMSDLRRVSSPPNGDAGGDGARGLDVSTRMLPWEAPFFLQSAVGIEEPRPLKPAQQLGGRSGDSSRLDRSYRTNMWVDAHEPFSGYMRVRCAVYG